MKNSSDPRSGRLVAIVASIVFALPVLVFSSGSTEARQTIHPVDGPAIWSFRVEGDAAARSGVTGAHFVAIDRPAGPLPSALRLVGVPAGASKTADFLLEEFDVFTPDARINAMTESGEVSLPRPTSKVYRGRSTDGSADAVLGVNGGSMQLLLNFSGETHIVLPMEEEGGRLGMT